MRRRQVLATLFAIPFYDALVAPRSMGRATAGESPESAPGHYATRLTRSGAVTSRYDGEIIEALDVVSLSGDAVVVTHQGVTVRNCRIRHAAGHGVHAAAANGLRLESLEIEHAGAPAAGAGPNIQTNNIDLVGCADVRLTRIRASKGAANIYLEDCEGAVLSLLELHDARGPEPRGQNVQLNACPRSVIEDFSGENGATSWTEDNVSVFHSDACTIRRGLVSYNNSPTGMGVMLEGSSECIVEDVDAYRQGNGAFGAVPSDKRPSGGCAFLRCRTSHSYNEPRDGREAPSSNGLSFYTLASPGASLHSIVDCSYFALANPRNLIWERQAVGPRPVLIARTFVHRDPVRLAFDWRA